MGIYVNVGNDGFASVRKNYYVDKSELLIELNNTIGSIDKLVCVSRPRRFGKSVAAKMICAYYDRSCDSHELFDDLKVANSQHYSDNLNRYHVIYIDITTFLNEETVGDLPGTIEKSVLEDLKDEFLFLSDETGFVDALLKVVTETKVKFVIVLDEWDALFREEKGNVDIHKKYIKFLRKIFKSSITDRIIEMAYMTGILPIKKYGTQSALTDFREHTMLQPKRLAQYVGFTENEVKNLCNEYNMSFEEMKTWYDGYSFYQAASIYNPNSVMEAIKNREITSYWTQTETYEALKVYIDMNFDGLRKAMKELLIGIPQSIDTGTFQNDMTNISSRDDVMTLLVHLGYLAYNSAKQEVRIPNEEIKEEFARALKHGNNKELIELITKSEQLLSFTLEKNEEQVAKIIEEFHNSQVAPLYYNNEQALRSVIRMAFISCIGKYVEIQELPTGKGIADIVYMPKGSSELPALIVELKWNQSADSAIKQIGKKDYPMELREFGGKILLIGINYSKKDKKHSCKIVEISAHD